MSNVDALSLVSGFSSHQAVVIPKTISAVQLMATEQGESRLGPITQLPPSAQLQICGDGFNERTVKVRWQESFYFVFRQDLEPVTSKN